MSPDAPVIDALEAIDPAEREETLIDEGTRVIAEIMACSPERAGLYLKILRAQKKVGIVVNKVGGALDQRAPIPLSSCRWSR